ncbi:HDOD domain-containing protein [Thioalkalivibrio sp.]|uniref:GGDEF domain-containing response regulator n=1 Tax=Thioalkalivibrio sp. TaxID=2093813 RepID=UPI003975BA36
MPIEQLRNGGQLPSPKGVAFAVMEVCRKEDATMDAVANVVQTDPALSGRLLRLANSAAHAARALASVREAIVRLGLRTVRQVTLGFSLVDQYRDGPCEAFNYQDFWSRSLLMALAARELGTLSRSASPDDLFGCGLLAQVGSLALATAYPAEYSDVLRRAERGDDTLVALERECLQIDHNECTAELLSDYGIPKALAEPVYYHERPEESGFVEGSRPHAMVHLFFLASRIADLGLAAEADPGERISELMFLGGKIGLDADELGALVDRIVKDWREWSELLQVPVRFIHPFARLSKTAAAAKPVASSEAPSFRVLVIEDDPSGRLLLNGMLSRLGHTVYSAANGEEGLGIALEVQPQVILIDGMLPDDEGLGFCRALRATDWGKPVYLLLLIDVEADGRLARAFEMGVDDYLIKPVSVYALRARIRAAAHHVMLLEAWERDRTQLRQFAAELAITNRRLEHAALTDVLTGLPNRRAGMDALARAWSAAERNAQPLTVMLIDVDRFKGINDDHGHAVGDRVLVEVGVALKGAARADDHVCRMGGEEFLVVCRNADVEPVLVAAERMREVVRSLRPGDGGAKVRVTVSIGVAAREAGMADANALVMAADQALYAAKHAGRDRVCLAAPGQVCHTQP